MPHSRAFPATAFFLALASVLAASDPAKVYEGLMSDSELYAGEGIVSLSTYGGDLGKAKASARERARGALVEGIKVRVTSSVTDTMSSTGEHVEARSQSTADLELENIQYRLFEDYPKPGQLTAVATLSKADYERQLAGRRASRFRPHWGFGASYLFSTFLGVEKFLKEQGDRERAGLPLKPGIAGGGGGASMDSVNGFGLQFRLREWSLLLENQLQQGVRIYQYDPADGKYLPEDKHFESLGFQAGYDYTPWALRVQPYLPLRLEARHVAWGGYNAWVAGASTGLGLRYWPSDSFFFDFSGRYSQPLNKAALTREGKPLRVSPTENVEWDMGAAQWQLNFTWTGF